MTAKAIRLYWWHEGSGAINFGDALSPLIVEHISGRPVEWRQLENCDLIAAGSLLDRAIMRRWKRLLRHPFRKIAVWGTGSFAPHDLSKWQHLDVRAVRGPKTRDAMNLPRDIPLGDPALLLGDMIKRPAKLHRWGVIPHLDDRGVPAIKEILGNTPDAVMIDLDDPDVLATARKIAACEFIASSSLHGIIASDALGVPSVWLGLSGDLHGGTWKFHDYLESVEKPADRVIDACDLTALENRAGVADDRVVSRRKHELQRAFAGLY